nr:MAG TPA: hypothetical protein [Caudoviricetes sp.]DAU04935.1 MAG TPA: hypothetical protein [Caudoviricetes sp.]
MWTFGIVHVDIWYYSCGHLVSDLRFHADI